MLSLRPEIERLVTEGHLAPERARLLVAVEEREVVSVHSQLRFLLWLGVAMVVGGTGYWFAENLDQLGAAGVTIAGALFAATAYLGAILLRRRASSLAADYLGLLAALLLSADVAWAESQFAILANWTHHLLILAAVHAVTAYLLENRLILVVAMTSLAAWFGVDQHQVLAPADFDWGLRLLRAAAAIGMWRAIHLLWPKPRFENVLEQGAIHLGFWSGLVWAGDRDSEWLGLALVAALAAALAWRSRRTDEHDGDVVWSGVYLLIAIDILIIANLDSETFVALWLTASSLAAVFGLVAFFVRRRSSQ